jgi:hypothetical protein
MLVNVPDAWQHYECQGAPVLALVCPDDFLPVAIVNDNGNNYDPPTSG